MVSSLITIAATGDIARCSVALLSLTISSSLARFSVGVVSASVAALVASYIRPPVNPATMARMKSDKA
jgi:hypothetical protein